MRVTRAALICLAALAFPGVIAAMVWKLRKIPSQQRVEVVVSASSDLAIPFDEQRAFEVFEHLNLAACAHDARGGAYISLTLHGGGTVTVNRIHAGGDYDVDCLRSAFVSAKVPRFHGKNRRMLVDLAAVLPMDTYSPH